MRSCLDWGADRATNCWAGSYVQRLFCLWRAEMISWNIWRLGYYHLARNKFFHCFWRCSCYCWKGSKTSLSVCFGRNACGSSVSKTIWGAARSLFDSSSHSSSRSNVTTLLCSVAFLFVPFGLIGPRLIRRGFHSMPISLTWTDYFYLLPTFLTASVK